MKNALVIGTTGQDGIYLSEHLLDQGYKVFGVRRPSTLPESSLSRMKEYNLDVYNNITWIYADLSDGSSLRRAIEISQPRYIYNLGAQSHVRLSFEVPELTANINALGFVRLLDAIRAMHLEKDISIYQASTSEMYGNSGENFQTLKTNFKPLSPYASSKLYAHNIGLNYIDSFAMKIKLGILFNHESPLRGTNFVTRKITKGVARISQTDDKRPLTLGNLDARRDWGFAKEYVQAMKIILEKGKSNEYIVSTGLNQSVRYFIEKAFEAININIKWKGKGIDEIGICHKSGDLLVQIDPWFYRPNELNYLCGSSEETTKELGWNPITKLDDLISIMVEADIKRLK